MAYQLPNEALADNVIKVGKLDATLANAFVPVGGIIMWNGSIAEAEALTTYGIIGIKVWIYKGEVFAKEFSQETNKITPKEEKE